MTILWPLSRLFSFQKTVPFNFDFIFILRWRVFNHLDFFSFTHQTGSTVFSWPDRLVKTHKEKIVSKIASISTSMKHSLSRVSVDTLFLLGLGRAEDERRMRTDERAGTTPTTGQNGGNMASGQVSCACSKLIDFKRSHFRRIETNRKHDSS